MIFITVITILAVAVLPALYKQGILWEDPHATQSWTEVVDAETKRLWSVIRSASKGEATKRWMDHRVVP